MSPLVDSLRPTAAWYGLLPVVTVVEAYIASRARPDWQMPLTTLILYLGVVNAAILFTWACFIYQLLVNPLRKLPQPPTWNPLIGNGLWVMEQPPCQSLRKWVDSVPTPDGVMAIRSFFNEYHIMPTSHATLKTVMSDCSYDYGKPSALSITLGRILGNGLITTEGDVHKFQRKRCLQSFQFKVIQRLYPLFWSKSSEMLDRIRLEENNTSERFEMDLLDWSTKATLDIIGIAAFGRDFESLKKPCELVEKYSEIMEVKGDIIVWFGLNMLLPEDIVRSIPMSVNKLVARVQRDLTEFATGLVKERRASKSEPGDDILSLLVKSNDFSDKELADQVLTFLAAGHETTAKSFAWVVYLLAQYPDIQRKLRDEVRTHIPAPGHGGTITSDQIEPLPWLNAVCQETLRLYPVVPFAGRQTVRDTVLAGHVLPAGTIVLLVPWAINRSHANWKDAESFKPERWINENGTANNHGGASSNYANLTFLHGPRSCIGQGFAKAELKCLIAAFVGRYEFELARPAEEYFPTGVVTIKPSIGMPVHVREVPGW